MAEGSHSATLATKEPLESQAVSVVRRALQLDKPLRASEPYYTTANERAFDCASEAQSELLGFLGKKRLKLVTRHTCCDKEAVVPQGAYCPTCGCDGDEFCGWDLSDAAKKRFNWDLFVELAEKSIGERLVNAAMGWD